ncbi:hypothetical protein KEM48_000948 [Puccinia striiformis f. sp. tritici PST-130]|nr:hypothetical protein KEM48_000948 [Puccinia striiformis f. sp. tritici PST-130]
MTKRDPVLVGFTRLIKKYEWTYEQDDIDKALYGLSIKNEVRSPEVLLNRMHSTLLPLLNKQIKTLSPSANPSDLWKQPQDKRTLILRTQTELENTIDKIKSIITSICPADIGPMMSPPDRMDDQDLKGLKSYRLHRLKPKFNEEVLYQINQVFTRAHELFQQSILPPRSLEFFRQSILEQHDVRPDTLDNRKNLTKDVNLASTMIESTIKLFEWSELDCAQENWPSNYLSSMR